MTVRRMPQNCLKAVCSVSEMAELVELSRPSLYSCIKKGIFLPPICRIDTKRPYYTRDMQAKNIEVKATGIGINGECVLWNRKVAKPPASPPEQPDGQEPQAVLLDGLKALGHKKTRAEIAEAITANFPEGTAGIGDDEVLRDLNRHFWCQERGRNP